MAKPPERKQWEGNYSEWFHKVLQEVPVYDVRYPVRALEYGCRSVSRSGRVSLR